MGSFVTKTKAEEAIKESRGQWPDSRPFNDGLVAGLAQWEDANGPAHASKPGKNPSKKMADQQ